MADLIVDDYAVVAQSIDDDIAEIEQQVFGEREADHTERIYKLKREVLEFRRAVLPLGEPMFRLMGGQVPGMEAGRDKKVRQHFRDVHDHILRVTDEIERQDSLLSDVLQANVARLSVTQNEVATRQNEDMRKISAWPRSAGADRDRRDLRDELRQHPRAALALRLLPGPRGDLRGQLRAVEPVQTQPLAVAPIRRGARHRTRVDLGTP